MIASPTYDRGSARLYRESAALRQRHDVGWVVDALAAADGFDTVLDLACGCGDLLAELTSRGLVRHHALGLDRSDAMLDEARLKLATTSVPVDFVTADLLRPPPLSARFDLVTMLSALHWLHPVEHAVLAWLRDRAAPGGSVCLTTYHLAYDGARGTDELALTALHSLGLPAAFSDERPSMRMRTRTPEALHRLINREFDVHEVLVRPAVMRVDGADEYVRYHQATFGTYYVEMAPPQLRSAFLAALGHAATVAMANYGEVTRMEVRAWIVSPRTRHTKNKRK